MRCMLDEDGNSSIVFGHRAKAKGDVEKDILKYCEKNGVPFDMAYTKLWENKFFQQSLGIPYDLSIEENLEGELNRALLAAAKHDVHSSDLKRKYKKLLKVDVGKELDSKKQDVEFTSGLQICTAVHASLDRVFQYYKHDMSEKEKLNYCNEMNEVMLKVHMDVQRYEKNLKLVESRMRAFVAEVMRPVSKGE